MIVYSNILSRISSRYFTPRGDREAAVPPGDDSYRRELKEEIRATIKAIMEKEVNR